MTDKTFYQTRGLAAARLLIHFRKNLFTDDELFIFCEWILECHDEYPFDNEKLDNLIDQFLEDYNKAKSEEKEE